MPPKGKTQKKGKSRRSRRGGKGGNALISAKSNKADLNQVIAPWMPLFPARTTRTLRYSENFTLTVTSGVMATYVYRANDLFDPNFTGTGHQPMGFDQMMVFYNHFCVTHARMICTFKNYTSNPCAVGVRIDGSSTAVTVIDRLIEIGGLNMAELEIGGSFGSNKALEASCNIAKLQGVSPSAITSDPNLRGDAATSPIEVTYFHISGWDPVGNTSTIQCSIVLEQRAVFMEPRSATESLSRLKSGGGCSMGSDIVVVHRKSRMEEESELKTFVNLSFEDEVERFKMLEENKNPPPSPLLGVGVLKPPGSSVAGCSYAF